VAFDGYYLQDPTGDGDNNTSDGIFVFDRRSPKPEVGELLRVRDIVAEFIPGGVSTGNLSITQLSFPEIIEREAGYPLPEPVVLGRGGRVPPNEIVISADEIDPPINLQDPADAAANLFNPEVDGIDFYESVEGMLVTIPEPVAVSGIRQFGTFSAEVFVLADDGADVAPADARTGRGGIYLQADPRNRGDQNPERIQIQFDGTLFGSTNFPVIKVGDRLNDVTGVVGYSFGNFEVNALGPFQISPSRTAPERTPFKGTGGKLSLASYNVLNLSAVQGDDAQRALVAEQIAQNLRAPDIVALQEIQDNNGDSSDCPSSNPGPCSSVLDATETLELLVDAIAAAGGPEYEFVTVDPLVETTDNNRDDPDTFGGISLGNIRNAFLYRPDRVELKSFLGMTRDELAARGVSEFLAFDTSRDPLLGVFEFRGLEVVVINNHLTSRFGSSPIFGGPQPFLQAGSEARTAQAQALNELARWAAENVTENVVVLGDLNTFEFTEELENSLSGPDGFLENLIVKNRDNNNYTFIFEGNSQALDHMFVSRRLFQQAAFDIVHVNVDFPRRFVDVVGSDHEPLVAFLKLRGKD
jgi:predicted extracellular nuclease